MTFKFPDVGFFKPIGTSIPELQSGVLGPQPNVLQQRGS